MEYEDDLINEVNIGKEKAIARKLRNSAWWMRKIREGRCHYCDREVDPKELTMDHVVPLSRGGKSKKGNLVPACKECNNRKKYMLPIEWEEYIESLMEKKSSI